MADKGKQDRGKREDQKKAKATPKRRVQKPDRFPIESELWFKKELLS